MQQGPSTSGAVTATTLGPYCEGGANPLKPHALLGPGPNPSKTSGVALTDFDGVWIKSATS